GAFVLWALHRGHGAAVDISLLKLRSLASSSAVLCTAGAAMYAGMFLLRLYAQQVQGTSVLTAALFLVPQGVGALLARVVASKIATTLGARMLAIGAFVVAALGTLPFAFADAHTSVWWLGAVLFVRGLGVGAVVVARMVVPDPDEGRLHRCGQRADAARDHAHPDHSAGGSLPRGRRGGRGAAERRGRRAGRGITVLVLVAGRHHPGGDRSRAHLRP